MIDPRQLAEVGAALAAKASIADLRERFPALHFSSCSDDDVSPRFTAALALDEHRLYLIAGASGHCLTLTHDPAVATGILIADKVDEV
ncbi:DUF6129 family protein [Denitromonas iodatirespirans]|uniref:DUF6129 domain-containing protein n=1 Tax=Denitromonas iodatirespirans TaxID=2795389 RepID=A0A944D5V2_DENI1|nr:DUF6129 family protein [Denitromonas iodatirespirans]MBT0960510.1 hypothetical protein [Denitromonas iodatirespirans]